MNKNLIIAVITLCMINTYYSCPYGYYICREQGFCQIVGKSCTDKLETSSVQFSQGYPFCDGDQVNCYGQCLPAGSDCPNRYNNNTSQCPEGTTLCNDICVGTNYFITGGTCNDELTTQSIHFVGCPSYIPEYCNGKCQLFGTPCNESTEFVKTSGLICPYGEVYCDNQCYPSGYYCQDNFVQKKLNFLRKEN